MCACLSLLGTPNAARSADDKGAPVEIAAFTCDFRDVDVRDILRGIGHAADVSVIADESVVGKLTMRLTNATIEEAIQAICASGGYHYRREGSRYIISKQPIHRPLVVKARADRLTLDASGADIREVLGQISAKTGRNLVPAPELDGQLSLAITDVPIDRAISLIYAAGGLEGTEEDGVTIVRKAAEAPAGLKGAPTGPEAPAEPEEAEPRGEGIHIQAESVSLSEVLQDISQQGGVGIIATAELAETLSLTLDTDTVDEALRAVLAGTPHSFSLLADGRYIVGDVGELADPASGPFVQTEALPLKYTTTEDALTFLSAAIPKDHVIAVPAHNMLLVTGTEDQIERARREVALVDQPAVQIMIEAVVVELTENADKDLNFDLRASAGNAQVELPLGSIVFDTATGFGSDALASLQALVTQGKAKVLAKPRVATVNGNEAEINIGTVRYFRTATLPAGTGSGAQSGGTGGDGDGTAIATVYPYAQIEQIEAGIKLTITPWVGAEGDIMMQLEPEVSSVSGTGPEGLPEVSRRNVSTRIRVKNGETVVLGGLRQRMDSRSVSRTPVLGKIPILGKLFTRTTKRHTETELMILITPTILPESGARATEHPEATAPYIEGAGAPQPAPDSAGEDE